MDCGRVNCRCTHDQGCVKGWIWSVVKDRTVTKSKDGVDNVVVTERDVVRPCATCDPERARIFQEVSSTWELGERLRARSNHNRQKEYDGSEQSKTRTL